MSRTKSEIFNDLNNLFSKLQRTMHPSYFNDIKCYLRSLDRDEKLSLHHIAIDLISEYEIRELLAGCFLLITSAKVTLTTLSEWQKN